MVKSVGRTNVGLKRKVNQDCFVLNNKFNASWAIVCEGLGGEKAGEVASKKASELINDYVSKNYNSSMNEENIKNMLVMACNIANSEIFDMGKENIEYDGMATTAIVSFIVDGTLHIAHVGDSRIYLIKNENVQQLTKDDSFVQALVESGTLSKDEAKTHPHRNYLTKAIGVEKNIEIYYKSFKISTEDVILMCTDGLYNYLDEKIISQNLKIKDENADVLVDKFVQLALDGGGSDNITVVIMFDVL